MDRLNREAPEELRQLLQASLEATGDGILVVDNQGRIILSNRRFARMWRIPQDVMEERDDIQLRAFVMDQLADPRGYLARIGELYAMDGDATDILMFSDGRIFERYTSPLRMSGTIAGRVMSFRDITAYREAHRRVEESEQLYRELVENANSIVLRWDIRGTITFINEYGQRLFGFSEAELVGRSVIGTIVAPRDSAGRDLEEMIRDITSTTEEYSYNENENTTKSGQTIWVSWSNKPVYDQAGQVSGILSIGTDITERKKLEQQLFQAQKMEAVGQLAGGIAHDFNNMLMVINGYCELLLEGLDETAAIREDIERIKSTAGRAAGLTRQLLAFGRRQIVQPRVLDLGKLLAEVREMVQRLVGENVTLKIEHTDDPCRIYADPLQIEQVILNLAANARDAMLRGGELEIDIRPVRIDRVQSGQRSILPLDAYVMCSVRDSGSGMSADTLKHVFEPFYTTKEPGKGTGLGLSTVYGIVKQNDGFVFVDSEPGQGSCFTIYFPRVGEQELEYDEISPGALEQVRGSGRILLVEGEAGVRRYTKTVLQRAGYTVSAAPDAADALGLAKTLDVDLLLSRSETGAGDGVDLVEKIRKTQPGLRVLIIADAADRGDRQVYPTIAKPFTSVALLRRIARILA